jgi:hypothetical protein
MLNAALAPVHLHPSCRLRRAQLGSQIKQHSGCDASLRYCGFGVADFATGMDEFGVIFHLF